MGRHLVLTVHAIGEQKPGETVDEVVGAATTEHPHSQRVPVTVEHDLIQLAETRFDGNPRNARLFPVHLRRVRPVTGTDETLFAEVYWADRSPAPKGPFWTFFDLLRVVLGLGYLAMDNVENNRRWFPTGVVHGFTWVFYGVVAPLNVMLAIGACLLLLDMTPLEIVAMPSQGPDRDWSQIPLLWLFYLHGGLTFGAGVIVLWRWARTYLVRIFGRGLFVLGIVILLMAEYGTFHGGFEGATCNWPTTDGRLHRCLPNLEGFVDFSIAALSYAWTTVIALTLLAYLSIFIQVKHLPPHDEKRHRVIYPSVCAAMAIFWLVFSSALWMGFVSLVQRVSQTEPGAPLGLLEGYFAAQLNQAFSSLSVTFAGIVLLGIIGFGLYVIRRIYQERLFEQPETRSRVVLNIRLQWAFFVAVLMIALFIAFHLRREFPQAWLLTWVDQWPMSELHHPLTLLEGATPYLMTSLLGLFLLIYYFSNFVAAGLGTARDIVTYAVMDRCMWCSDASARKENFTERNAINARFRRVLYYGLEVLKPDRITIISHSQGTVIATQMLQNEWVKRKIADTGKPLRPPLPVSVLLVTMGSPVTHIYRRYFGEVFQVSTQAMPPGLIWHNIFRTDDFVGTTIDEVPGLAGNWEVKAAGHTGYFTDYFVWERLWRDVGLRIF